jgi:hypothetical protein
MPNPIRWAARTFIKPITIRLRWYLQAEIMAELAALRAQLGTPTPAATHSLDSVIHSVESALLTLAVLGEERKQDQGALACRAEGTRSA